MANRSKKIVLSVRLPPYLKAGLDIMSTYLNKPTVSIIEETLDYEIDNTSIFYPVVFSSKKHVHQEKMSIRQLMSCIWSEDEVLFKLRLGIIGEQVAGTVLSRVADLACNVLFKGEELLFGDLNGRLTQNSEEFQLIEKHINLQKIKEEWDTLNSYITFLEKNKPLNPSYEQYKKMLDT